MTNKLDFSPDRAVTGSELLKGSYRLSRVEWLTNNLHENDLYLFQDGELSQLLFTDLIETFVGGQFIATILLGFTFIERTIAGRLSFVGDKKTAKESSTELLDAALSRGWLSIGEHSKLNELRQLRNPIVHFREHLADTRPEVKAVLSGRSATQMFESDAKQILAVSIHVLKQTSL